jgi:hypothetical protein
MGAMTIQQLSALRLDPRENGPKGKSNGGFACGTFASLVGGTADVRLVRGVPLGVDLTVDGDATHARFSSGGRLLATARATDAFVLEPPVAPTLAEAAEARSRHPFYGVRHLLSHCVVCGPQRSDGLRVTPGPLAEHPDILATPFAATDQFAVNGQLRAAAVWGALDCPSYPAAWMRTRRFGLLGSLQAHQVRPIAVGEQLVVVGWTLGEGNRSTRTASAIIDQAGQVVASARAVWVALRHQWAVNAMAKFLS